MTFFKYIFDAIASFFSFLFYLTAIYFMFKELQVFYNPKVFMARIKRQKATPFKDKTEEQLFSHYEGVFYACWLLLGFFTSQWLTFGFILLVCFVPVKHWVSVKINGLLSFLLLVFIVVNKYHLHIDFVKLIFNY